MAAGNLWVNLGLRSAAFDKGLKRSRTNLKGFGSQVKSMSKTLLAFGGIAGFGFLAKQMVASASAAEETQAKFNTVFRELAQSSSKWAQEFGDNVGRATQDVQMWMATLQDTFVPLGIARDEAAALGESLVSLAVDVASFNNRADADVIRDFTSALVGNHETVRKYGIIISAAGIAQEALNQGLDKTFNELTDLEKVQLRYTLIQKGSTDAQGDAVRTGDSYANQVKRLKANITELQTELGGPLVDALSEVLQSVNDNREAWGGFFKLIADGAAEIARLPQTLRSVADIVEVTAGVHESQLSAADRRRRELITRQGNAAIGGSGRVFAPQGTQSGGVSGTVAAAIADIERDKKRIESRRRLQDAFSDESAARRRGTTVKEQSDLNDDLQIRSAMRIQMAETTRVNLQRLVNRQIREREEKERKHTAMIRDRWEWVGQGMAQSMTSAADRILFESGKLRDALHDIFRSMARDMAQAFVFTPFSEAVVGGAGQLFGLPTRVKTAHSGLTVPNDGLFSLQRGEHVTDRANAGGGGPPTVIFNNKTDTPIGPEGPPRFEAGRWVINVVSENISNRGILFQQMRQ